MKTGHVIFLNGTSSAGKTTIARALQEHLIEPYMYISVDDFFHLYPDRIFNPTSKEEAAVFHNIFPAVIGGFHKCIAALAKSGNNVIVDHVLVDAEWLKECVRECRGIDVLFVGVRCPMEITEKREKARGDRDVGLARSQYELVHAHEKYDVEVDTSELNPNACVVRIENHLHPKKPQTAFQELEMRFMAA